MSTLRLFRADLSRCTVMYLYTMRARPLRLSTAKILTKYICDKLKTPHHRNGRPLGLGV